MKLNLISNHFSLAVAAGLAVSAISSHAQDVVVTGALTDVPAGGGVYDYTLTLHNTGTSWSRPFGLAGSLLILILQTHPTQGTHSAGAVRWMAIPSNMDQAHPWPRAARGFSLLTAPPPRHNFRRERPGRLLPTASMTRRLPFITLRCTARSLLRRWQPSPNLPHSAFLPSALSAF